MIPNAETTSRNFNSEQPTAKSDRAAMMIVFFIVVVDLLGFGIVLPLLPVTGQEYLLPLFPGDGARALRGAMIGLLLASFSAMQFFFAPMWGRLSDRVGRRPILLVGLVGSVLFYALFGYAAGIGSNDASAVLLPREAQLALILMFVARIGAGMAGATISTAQAVIADCTPPEKRKHGMAMIGAAFGIAFTFGPMLGALAMYAAPHGRAATSYTGYVASGLSGIALILALGMLRETRKFAHAGPTPGEPAPVETEESTLGAEVAGPSRRRIFNFSAWRWALSNGAIAPVILTFFLATIGFGAFESTLALLIKDILGLDKEHAYWIFAYVGFILVLTQGFLYRKIAKSFSEVILMTAGIVLMSVGVIGLAAVSLLKSTNYSASSFLMTSMMIVLAVAVVGFAFLTPSAQALISRRTSAERQGEILGVNQSASALARILGPIFGNLLYAVTSTHMLPYIFGAGLLLLMLPLIPRIAQGSLCGRRTSRPNMKPSLCDLRPDRIALIKPSALGDVVHALPVLHALWLRFPGATISWVIRESLQSILTAHPDLDETISFDRHGGIRATVALARQLEARKFDLVVDLQGLLRTGLMCAATRAPRRVGLSSAREGSRWFYSDLVNDDLSLHAVDRYWRVAEALGAGNSPKQFHVPISNESRAWANQFRCEAPVIVVSPGSRRVTKRWTHFSDLVNRAQSRFGGSAILVGSPDEAGLSARVAADIRGNCLNFAGKTTLPQLAAMLERADVVLANDSGPLHLAAALGRPIVAPYTCTTIKRHGPYLQSGAVESSVWCRGSYVKRCSRLDCMIELSANRLWPVLEEVLFRWASHSRSA